MTIPGTRPAGRVHHATNPPGAVTSPASLDSHSSEPTQPAVSDRAPEQPVVSFTRTAVLGFIGTAAIVVGAVLGGASFETHLPGAWFFGMPGGLFGSLGTSDNLPPVA